MTSGTSANRHRHRIWYLIPTFFVALVFFFIFERHHDELTIAVPQGIEAGPLKELAAAYSREKDLNVKIVEFPYDQLYEHEIAEVDNDPSGYDVILADDPWLPALVDRSDEKHPKRIGLYALPELKKTDRDDFVPSCIDVCRYLKVSSDLYALPFVGNSQLFVYKAEKEDTPAPKSWKEVIETGSTKAGLGYVMRVGPGNSIVTDFMPLLWDSWRRAPPEKPHAAALQTATMEAFETLRTLGRSGRANLDIVSNDDFDLAIHLVQGTASMSIVWSAWAMAFNHGLPKLAPGDPRYTLYVTDMPMPSEHALGAWLLAVPAHSRNPDLAKQFVRDATLPDQMKKAADNGNPPARRSILEDKGLQKKFPSFPCQLRSLLTARPRARKPKWHQDEQDFGKVLSKIYAGQLTPGDDWIQAERFVSEMDDHYEVMSQSALEGIEPCPAKLISDEKPR